MDFSYITENFSDIEENYNTTEENADIEENYNATEENADIEENYNATKKNTDIKENYNATEENADIEENYNATEGDSSIAEESKTKESKSEETIYSECENHLGKRRYPAGASKLEKAVIRKRAKNFQIVDGILHYKGKDGLRQVVTDAKTKEKILEACHDDPVGGCHFGRDKTTAKVTTRYYWKGIIQDVDTWVSITVV